MRVITVWNRDRCCHALCFQLLQQLTKGPQLEQLGRGLSCIDHCASQSKMGTFWSACGMTTDHQLQHLTLGDGE